MTISINKKQTNLLKGVGILLIVLHNYFHTVNPSTGENEFTFDIMNSKNLYNMLTDSFLEFINLMFSFFGHYGVQIFIFISGYGLAKSYLSKKSKFLSFIGNRARKLYPVFIIAIVMIACYNFVLFRHIPDVAWLKSIAYKLLMIHNMVPNEALSIVGPWWFYGLIMQMYILFIPLFFIIKKYKLKGLIAVLSVSYIIMFLLYNPLLDENVFIMANSPGHMPEFALGVYLALYPKINFKFWYYPILLAIFVIGNLNFYIYPFTFIAITILLIFSLLHHFRKDYRYTSFIEFYGKLSMFLFAIHGFMRNPLFAHMANKSNNPFITIGYGLLFLLFVTIIAYITQWFYTNILKKRLRFL